MGALGLVAAGCGSGDSAGTTTRAAAAGSTCPEQRSGAQYFTFMNDLDTDVTLDVPRDSWSCDGYSGVSTPGNLSGRVIGHPGAQPRIRMETSFGERSYRDTAFRMAVKAGGDTLATVDLSVFLYVGPMYPWGIKVDGRYRCYKPVVELKKAGSVIGYLTMTSNCQRSASGETVFQFRKDRP